jgi:hypothetical protein
MTGIWDSLSGRIYDLSVKWDESKAKELKRALEIVYDFIKDDRKYQAGVVWSIKGTLPLLEALAKILKMEWKPMKSMEEQESLIRWAIEGLHDFDHAHDGHYTEQIMFRAKGKKKLYNEFLEIVQNSR